MFNQNMSHSLLDTLISLPCQYHILPPKVLISFKKKILMSSPRNLSHRHYLTITVTIASPPSTHAPPVMHHLAPASHHGQWSSHTSCKYLHGHHHRAENHTTRLEPNLSSITRNIVVTYGSLHTNFNSYVMQVLHTNFTYGFWKKYYIWILHSDFYLLNIRM